MNRIAKLVVLLIAMAVLTAGCNKVPTEARKRSYVDAENRFAFDVPSDWAKRENFMGSKVAFLSPTMVDGFSPNINVVVVQAAANNIESLLEVERKQLSQLNGYKELRSRIIDHPAGCKAVSIVYEHSMLAKPLRVVYCSFLVRGHEYGLSATMPADAADQWAEPMQKIVDSFIAW